MVQQIEDIRERDILDVVREIETGRSHQTNALAAGAPEAGASVDSPEAPSATASPDPADLLNSLKKKRDLMGLLDGYSEAKGIVEKRQELEEAISFLEKLIPASGDK